MPAAGLLTKSIKLTKPPAGTVDNVVPLLFCTTTVPDDWLLLNVYAAPIGRVVASGNLYVCPPEPVMTQLGVDAAVRVVVVPAAAKLVNPS